MTTMVYIYISIYVYRDIVIYTNIYNFYILDNINYNIFNYIKVYNFSFDRAGGAGGWNFINWEGVLTQGGGYDDGDGDDIHYHYHYHHHTYKDIDSDVNA